MLNGLNCGKCVLNALFFVLKRKVGKDTQNIKRAVCCSEVGPIDETHAVCRDITLMVFVTEALSRVNASSVVLTGIWISFVCRLTSNLSLTLMLVGNQADVDVF